MLEQISNVCVRNTNDWLRLLDVRVDIPDVVDIFHNACVVLHSIFYVSLSLSLSLCLSISLLSFALNPYPYPYP